MGARERQLVPPPVMPVIASHLRGKLPRASTVTCLHLPANLLARCTPLAHAAGGECRSCKAAARHLAEGPGREGVVWKVPLPAGHSLFSAPTPTAVAPARRC